MITKCDRTTGLNARAVFSNLLPVTWVSIVAAFGFVLASSGSLSGADIGVKSGAKVTARSTASPKLSSVGKSPETVLAGEKAVVASSGGGGIEDTGTTPKTGDEEIKSQPSSVDLQESVSASKAGRTVELSSENAAEKISSIRLQTDGLPVTDGTPSAGSVPVVLNSLVKEFRTASDDYVAAQKELTRKLKGASAEERARLRETLQANKEKFSHSTAPLREQLHDRLEDLKRDLKEHAQVINAGAGGSAGRRRGGD